MKCDAREQQEQVCPQDGGGAYLDSNTGLSGAWAGCRDGVPAYACPEQDVGIPVRLLRDT